MEIFDFILLLEGLGVGFLVGWLFFKLKANETNQPFDALRNELQLEVERSKKLSEDLRTLNEELKKERSKALSMNSENATLKADLKNLNARLVEHKEELGNLQMKFSHEFRNLANEIFDEKSKKFTDQNKSNLDALLTPLGQKLQEFEKKVDATNKESLERNSALREQIIGLRELNDRMTKEAENLTKALKGDVKMQGDWGEMILEGILEKSGLEKNREYFMQESFQTEEGRRLRPDVIVKLPENKNIVIDAKMSLIAYERFMNAENDAEKEAHLKEHLLSIKAHVRGLSEKNYHQLFDGGSLDYVLMFVPIEPAFALVVQHGGDLYNEAHEKSIIIVSPATLIATLRTVSSIWKHEYQNRNALEIARQGGALYDKFKSFVDDLLQVGTSINRSKDQYTQAMNKLVDGKDNLVRKTERLKELGAKTTKSINENMLSKAGAKDQDQTSLLL